MLFFAGTVGGLAGSDLRLEAMIGVLRTMQGMRCAVCYVLQWWREDSRLFVVVPLMDVKAGSGWCGRLATSGWIHTCGVRDVGLGWLCQPGAPSLTGGRGEQTLHQTATQQS